MLLLDISYKQFPSTKSYHPIELRKRGIFALGNHHADEFAYNHLIQQGENPTNTSKSNKIIVYGNGMRALCLLGRLEEYGVDLTRVVWILSNDNVADTTCMEVQYTILSYTI